MAARDLAVRFSGTATDLARATGTAKRSIGGVGDEAERTEKRSSRAFGAIGKLGPIAAGVGGAAVAGFAIAGAAAVGFGALAIKVGADVDDAVDGIRTSTGATGKELDGLTDSFKNVAKGVPSSFGDVSAAIGDLNTRLGLTGKPLEDVTKQVLQLEQVTGQKTNINDLSAALSGFAVPGKDATRTLDELFQIAQATGVPVNKLTSVLGKQGATLKTLGFSLTDSAVLYGTLDKAGLNANAMTKALGAGLVKLTKDGEKPAEAFSRVKGELQGLVDKGDEAGALQLASKVFGTKGAPQFVEALKSGKVNLDDLSKAAGQSKDTIDGVARSTEDFPEKWARFKNSAALALEPVGSLLFSAVGKPLDAIGKWVDDHGDDIAAVGTSAAETLKTFGTVASAAFGPFISGLTEGKSAFTSFAEFVSTNQEGITRALIVGTGVALTFAGGLGRLAVAGLRGFARLSSAQADYVQFAVTAYGTVLHAGATAFSWIPGVGDKLKKADEAFSKIGGTAVTSMRLASGQADAAADGLEKKLIPSIEKARSNLDKVGKTEIAKAQLRDGAAKAAIAIDAIGTRANGSQLKLKSFRDMTRLTGSEQRGLTQRLTNAGVALRDQVGAARAAGNGQKALTKTWQDGKDKLRAEFIQMGLSKKEAGKLAAKYAGIKPKVKTTITTPGMTDAQAKAKDLKKKLDDLKNKKITTSLSFSTNANSVRVNLNKQFSIGKNGPKMTAADGGPIPVPRRAVGGPIPGRGGPRQDNILGVDRKTKLQTAWVSAKEFVVNAMAYRKNKKLVEDINAGRPMPALAGGGSPAFGPVTGSYASAGSRAGTNGGKVLSYGLQRQLQSLLNAKKKAKAQEEKKLRESTGGPLDGGGAAVGGGRGAARTAGLRLGADSVGTYPGHQPSMNKAWDYMISSMGEGDRIAGHLAANRKAYGISYLIWNRRMLRDYAKGSIRPGTWGPYFDGNSSNPNRAHTNHVHASFYKNGGAVGAPKAMTPRLYDTGGWVPPGNTLVQNKTGRPELLLNAAQQEALAGGRGPQIVININGAIDPDRTARQVKGLLEEHSTRRGGMTVGLRTTGASQ